jgi:hypothetical protein
MTEISERNNEIQSKSRKERHGAYRVERLILTDEVDGRTRLGHRVREIRLGFALSLGYPTWLAMPAPLKEAVKNATRLSLVCERLFSGFWTGAEVPKIFYTAAENLRRQLNDLGLEPRSVSPDVAAILATMPGREARR